MVLARKVIGFLIILLMAMPTLFGLLWAYGVAQSVLTPDVIVKVPQRIVVNAPMLADELVASASRSGELDANTRRWALAVATASAKPSEVMTDSGLTKWLDQEVSPSLTQLGRAIEGRNNGRSITLNLEPFKNALQSEPVKEYLNSILANLPQCSETESDKWLEVMANNQPEEDLPACRPNDAVLERVVLSANEEITNMPDQETILDPNLANTPVSDVVKKVLALTFFIPAGMFLLGGLLMSFSKRQFFKVTGISVLLTGLISLVIASIADNAVSLAPLGPTRVMGDVTMTPKLAEFMSQEILPLVLPTLKNLFDPVIKVSVITVAVGLILLGISFLLNESLHHKIPSVFTNESKTESKKYEKKP